MTTETQKAMWRKATRKYAKNHPEKKKQDYLTLKREVLSHYSPGEPKCAYCGDIDLEELSLDHVKNDGKQHRKEHDLHAGTQTYLWVKRNNYPPIFQVLCLDCNLLKSLPKQKISNFVKRFDLEKLMVDRKQVSDKIAWMQEHGIEENLDCVLFLKELLEGSVKDVKEESK